MRHSSIDRIGSMASFLCAVHCFATPLVITFLPLVYLGWLANDVFEIVFLSLSGLMAVGSICWGFRSHRKSYVLMILAAGIGCMVAWHIFEKHWTAAFGGLLIAISHVVNMKLCHSCKKCH